MRVSQGRKRRLVECDLCGGIKREDKLESHRNGRKCRKFCDFCGTSVQASQYQEHRVEHTMNLNFDHDISTTEDNVSSIPMEEENRANSEDDQGILDMYKDYAKHINTFVSHGSIRTIHNFKIIQFSSSELAHYFQTIFKEQQNAFKFNISLGVILRNRVTGELAYYRSSQNNQLLFDETQLVRNSNDRALALDKLKNIGLIEAVDRPNSQWVFVEVTNVSFYVFKLLGIPIGSFVELPHHLLSNKGLYSLVKTWHGRPYSDKKCFFRCLALRNGSKINSLEGAAKELLKKYCKTASIIKFEGVTLDQLEEISRIFGVSIKVYEQNEAGVTNLIFRSTLEGENPLLMNLFQDHFSYIKNINLYSKSFRCPKCDALWRHHGHFNRHLKTCEAGVKKFYGRGAFEVKESIYEKLEKGGISIPQHLRVFPFRATFDVECMLCKVFSQEDTVKTKYTSEHHLVSVSVCSNVPGFEEPQCFVLSGDGKQEELVEQFIGYLKEISEKSSDILKQKFAEVLKSISDESLLAQFVSYLEELPVISFNGARYDLNVLKKYLIPVLVKSDSIKYVIKKGSSYMTIKTADFKFLDIIYYIAPGFNYDSFLKAYKADQQKSYFPYEFLDSYNKLSCKQFPEYEAFYSSLNNQNTLEPTKDQKLSSEEAELIGRSPAFKDPITKEERKCVGMSRYTQLRTMFQDNAWCIRDYLAFYNNLDVGPFIVALENLSGYYKERGIDVFKEALSGK